MLLLAKTEIGHNLRRGTTNLMDDRKKSRSFHLSLPNKQVSCGTTHLSQIKFGVSTMTLSFKRK